MPEVAFVMSSRERHSLRELADAVAYELGLQAVASSLHAGAFPEPRPDRVFVLLDPRGYVAAEGTGAVPDDAILARTVLLCVEPPPTDPSDPHLALLRRGGAVFVIDQHAVLALSRLGIRARLLRPGYTRIHDHFDPDAERPIDVLFLGARTPRRTRYLDAAAPVLQRMSCEVRTADAGPPRVRRPRRRPRTLGAPRANGRCWHAPRSSSTFTPARTSVWSGAACSTPSTPGRWW